MKKILIATGIYPPDIGGPATYSKLLSDELPKRGFEVSVLSFGSVRHLPKLVRHLVYFWRLYRLAPKFDLIYAQDPISVGLPVSWASRLSGRPYFLKIVGDYAWEQGRQRFGVTDSLDQFVHTRNYFWPVRILKSIETQVACRAAKIIVPSNYLKKIIEAWGVPSEKITVIYNAFDIPPEIDQTTVKGKLEVPGKLLLSIGRLVPWKGFSLLVEILPALLARYPDLQLVIIGSGPDLSRLEALAKERGVSKQVRFTGQLSRAELFHWLRLAKIFLLNTSYEGFSHQLLEVMAVGTPIITTPVGGNPELIENGKTGLLVECDNHINWLKAVETLLDKPSLGLELANNGKKMINQFQTEVMLEKLVKILS